MPVYSGMAQVMRNYDTDRGAVDKIDGVHDMVRLSAIGTDTKNESMIRINKRE
jgi:hypothetical protein